MRLYFIALLMIAVFITSCSQGTKEATTTLSETQEQKNQAQTSSTTQEEIHMATLRISTPAFADKGKIPSEYTCDGPNVNPELKIEGIPKNANSLVLIVDDPDSPSGLWTHWVVFDIPPSDYIAKDSVPGTLGLNDFKLISYKGPCPPSGNHRYAFKVFALDTKINLKTGASVKSVEQAMQGHIIAQGELIGFYQRK